MTMQNPPTSMPPEPVPPEPPMAPIPPNPPAPSAPIPAMTPPGQKTGLSIASLIVGILSLCGSGFVICGGIFGLAAVILGVLGINTKGRTMAIVGIILGAVGLLMTLVFRIFHPFSNLFNNVWQQFLNRSY